MTEPMGRELLGLPIRPFLFTVDQVAQLIGSNERQLTRDDKMAYFDGRSIGFPKRHQLKFRNIAGPDETPEWRCAERELIRWLKVKGFTVKDRGYLES